MKLRKSQCKSCPFKEDGLKLTAETMAEIQAYLVKGINHFCHGDRTDNTVCLGGRNYQLDIWHKLGLIDEPTNKALAEKMSTLGVKPKDHIY